MNIDIAHLLREALIESGCDTHKMGDFDSHSTIALEFNGHPDILISQIDDDIWLWTRLMTEDSLSFSQRGAALLEQLMKGCDFTVTGQLQLATNEGYLELRGMVHPRYLESPSAFASALDEFFSAAEIFSGLIR